MVTIRTLTQSLKPLLVKKIWYGIIITFLISNTQILAFEKTIGSNSPLTSEQSDLFHIQVQDYWKKQFRLLEKDIEQNNPEYMELYNLLDTFRCAKFSSVIGVMQSLFIVMDLVQQIKSLEVESKIFDQLCIMALLQLMIPVDMVIRTIFFNKLAQLEDSLSYWQEQQQRPLFYFFHKVPVKWVTGQSQASEIANMLFNVQRMQEETYQSLGKWALHLSQFDQNLSSDEQYKWIAELVVIASYMLRGSGSTFDECLGFENAVSVLRESLAVVNRDEDRFADMLMRWGKPIHIARNWLRYTVGASAAAISIYYLYQNAQVAYATLTQAKDTLYRTFFQVPRDALCEAFPFLNPFFGRPLPPQPNRAPNNQAPQDGLNAEQHAQNVGNALARVLAPLQSVVQDQQNNVPQPSREQIAEQLKNSYYTVVAGYFDFRREKIPHAQWGIGDRAYTPEQLRARINLLDSSLITECINQCLSHDMHHVESRFRNVLGYSDQVDLLAHSISMLNIFIQLGNHTGSQISNEMITRLQPAIQAFLNAAAAQSDHFITELEHILHEVNTILRQNQVTLAISSCVPIALACTVTGAGLYKTYYWWQAIDYSPIRKTLVEIAHLLNIYDDVSAAQMRSEHFGKLLYLSHKLRTQKYKIPYYQRAAFERDIERLEGRMSGLKKGRVIELMYKAYKFLNIPYALS